MAEINLPELSVILSEIRALRDQLNRIEASIAEKEGKPYLTIQEVAAELKFSEASVKSWCTKGRRHPQTMRVIILKSYRSEGNHYRIKRKDLEIFKELFSTK